MQPPVQRLDGAYERVARAREHLTDLNQRVDAFREAKSDDTTIKREKTRLTLPDGREIDAVLSTVRFPIGPTPAIISILVGETIYNLRAALDYLIYELARFDAKKIIDGTQFPIDACEKDFQARKRGFLKGVSDEHVAAIKRLQPFDGCDWTKVLRDLSNPDKHRHLTITSSPVVISPAAGSTEAIIAGETVDAKDDVSVHVVLADGTLIVETLEQLASEVTAALDVFRSEID